MIIRLSCTVILISFVALSASKTTKALKHDVRKFPDGFKFGTATASYQVEGAWNEDGKTENIWDVLSHNENCLVKECHTGDIADDSYHQVERDVEMMRELGLDYYRFSLSWARILPNSFSDEINEAGVQYYNDLINEMLKYNIEPMITLYHWDLPQKLQEVGGWTNPHIVDWFADYARTCFELFGDRAKIWITINEPREVCLQGYGIGALAPLLTHSGWADYMCAKNLLVAHAKAYHIYDQEFRPTQGGTIGIALSAYWQEPETDSEDDINAAEDCLQFNWGIYANPIYSEKGDFPVVMKEKIAAKSAEQGYPRSRLPEFTPEEVEYIRGTADFFGLNHYTTELVFRNASVYGFHKSPSANDDMDAIAYQPDNFESSAANWLKVVPWGFYKLLSYIRENYNNPTVYITENGYASSGGIEDDERISYYVRYISAMLDAMEEGSDIQRYTAWSLMDNFEWMRGYTERFGLYEVDYEDPARTRTPRKSAFVYKQMLRTRELDPHYEPPQGQLMTIDDGPPQQTVTLSLKCEYLIPEMFRHLCLVILVYCVALSASKATKSTKDEVRKFPDKLKFGTATASYQIEGAWNEDGKSENIWDVVAHRPDCAVKECHTGDIADDSYHQVERDVEMMRELGLDYYRFSLSWARILPNSFSDKVNELGVQYYNNLINEMLKYNIEPMISLYHWDLPQKLQEVGGWTNPHIVDWFADYARTCFELFGDRTKIWLTINEPREVCLQGYADGSMAPLLTHSGWADYMCAKNLLMAHAKAYHIYDQEFRPAQGGTIGMAVSAYWYEPESDSEDDIAAADAATQFNWGIYANPVYSDEGDFPAIMKEKIATKSAEQGYPRSRLPQFTPEEVEYVRGTADFFGLNHYSSNYAYRNASVYGSQKSPSMYDDMDAIFYTPQNVPGSAADWLKVIPWGFYKLLVYIKDNFNNPPIYITENGYASDVGLEDDDRISYYVQYLDAMLDAMEEGADVRGYTAWSLMDNFEWLQGYTQRFGLYEVDYEDPARTRTPRKSAFVYKQMLRTRELDPHYEPPQGQLMTIDDGH
ncbi:lactase/phlorizin hydrolase-like [Pectinophora gossypiella]|uniref:lactase/phlorizin hydrolase-like n=1 Tax=Pectinophora gossypiella TaxID=13191 RepID=UPI00214F00D4|nr:lactase/phlorizin hydrolase-like [Pectinophora gossypiella]